MVVSEMRAADLPLGSVVVDDDRSLVWIAVRRRNPAHGRWSVTGMPTFVKDRQVDEALAYTAKVLRVGDGSRTEEAAVEN